MISCRRPSRASLRSTRVRALATRWLAAAALGLAAQVAPAADWYAAPSGSATGTCVDVAHACTIQRAIDVAAAYDTVRVAAGDYAFAGNRIRIEKEGLRLIGDNSPFAAPYGTGPG